MAIYEAETGLEYGETGEWEFGEVQHEDEQFLGSILGSVLGGEAVSPLSEAQEAQLASELLELSSEEELEQFLGGLIKKVGGFVKGPVGQALGGVLKNVAKKALPVVGGALGSMVAPGIGTAIGSKLGSMASGLFEVELEALPGEQAEYEVARRVVGLSAAAARAAATARPRPGISPHTVARAAVARAARTYAPGLYRSTMHSLRATARPHRAGAQMQRRPGAALLGQRPGAGVGAGAGAGAGPGLAAGAGTAAQRPPAVPGQPMFVPPVAYAGSTTYAPTYGPAAGQQPADGATMGTDGAWLDEPYGDGADAIGAPPAMQSPAAFPTAGRWYRRGRRIILAGA